MFGKKEKEVFDTVIGSRVEIQGKIISQASLRIDGKVIGDIEASQSVIIGKEGYVEGNIKCKRISIVGKVKGNIISYENVEILSTGRLEGDLKYGGKFSIEEGGVFLGKSELIEEKSMMEESKENIGL